MAVPPLNPVFVQRALEYIQQALEQSRQGRPDRTVIADDPYRLIGIPHLSAVSNAPTVVNIENASRSVFNQGSGHIIICIGGFVSFPSVAFQPT